MQEANTSSAQNPDPRAPTAQPNEKNISRAPSNERGKSQATSNDLENRFSYHKPKEGQNERYEAIRAKAKELAYLLNEECPPSREAALALTHLEESVHWANASIARHE